MFSMALQQIGVNGLMRGRLSNLGQKLPTIRTIKFADRKLRSFGWFTHAHVHGAFAISEGLPMCEATTGFAEMKRNFLVAPDVL